MKDSQLFHGSFSHSRSLPASPAAIFAAFADTAVRRRWFQIPSEPDGAHHELDFRVGGAEIARGRLAGAGLPETIEYRSRFVEIVPEERIIYTYELSLNGELRSVSLVSVELAPDAGGTRLTYTEHYVFTAFSGDGWHDRAERERGIPLQLNGLQAVIGAGSHARGARA